MDRPAERPEVSDPERSAVPFRRRAILLLIVLLALALRLAYLHDIRDQPLYTHLVVDQEAYDSWAAEIAAGDWLGQKVFYQDPLYPYLLGAVYAVFGRSLTLVYLLQSALSAATCLLVYGIGRRAFDDPRIGSWAALFWAVYKVDFFYQAQIGKTGPGTCLAALALWLLLLARDRPGRLVGAAAGSVAALLPLDRGNYLLVVPLLIAWLCREWWKRLSRAALVPAFAVVAGAALVLAAVAARNYAVSGEIVLTTSQAGPNFYIGNNELANGRYVTLPFVRAHPRYEAADFRAEAERRSGRPLSGAEVSRFWTREALRWIGSNPLRAAKLQLLKLRVLLYRIEAPDNLNYDFFRDRLSAVLRLPLAAFWLAGPFGVAGLVLALARRRAGLLSLYVLSYAATLIAFFVVGRYRMALVPVLLVLAAYALVAAWDALRLRSWKTVALLVSAYALTAVVAYPRWTRPKYDVAWSRLGNAHAAAGNHEEAVAAFRESLAIDPRPLLPWIGLGRAYEALGRNEEALETYRECVETHPESAVVHFQIGALLLRLGRTAEGAEELRRGLALDPAHEPAREWLRSLGHEPF